MAASSQYKVQRDVPASLLKLYLSQKELAVDTELQGLRLGRDHVVLVQLCDRKGNVCLVRPSPGKPPPNLKKLLTHDKTLKVFHYALTDVAFLQTSLGIAVGPYCCTKVMSKLVRTYTDQHSLKHLVKEFLDIDLEKTYQTSNWSASNLSPAQLDYAAKDVLYLLKIYDRLIRMLKERGALPSGMKAAELNRQSQQILPTLVELILNGYGDRDQGWETSLFNH